MLRRLLPFLYILIIWIIYSCARDIPATAPYTPISYPNAPPSGGLPGQGQAYQQKRLFMTNDKVRVGIDLNAGGAITYLSEATSTENMVNNSDLGRQTQTAIYAGPVPYTQNGKQPVDFWRNLGWNPVQTGDYYHNSARIVSYQQTENMIYVKNIPLIWPLNNEPADCTFEHWYELRGNSVHIRCHIEVKRADTTQYEARTQEFPCVYLNGPYYRMVSYLGHRPYTNEPVSEFYNTGGWYYRFSSEHWTALLNEQGRGIGLYKPGEVRFGTDKFGTERTGGEFDKNSGYMNTQPFLLIDHNGSYDYEYDLILGTTEDIRQFVYSQPRPAKVPDFRFTNSRLGWYYTKTQDRGWPIQNELSVRWERESGQNDPFRINSPMSFWYASDISKLYIQAAFQTKATLARLVWFRPEEYREITETPGRYIDFPIIGDGQFRTYEIDTSKLPQWEGVIAQIALSCPESQYIYEKGSTVRIRSVTTTPP